MKRLLCMMLVFSSISVFSQRELKVISFNQSSSDISARTNQRDDPRGVACALIKVQFPMKDVNFEGDIIGEVAYKTNEHWVYMPQNSTELVIKIQGYKPLKVDFNAYNISAIESKGTYELCILKEQVGAPQIYNEGMIALTKNDFITAFEKLEMAYEKGFALAAYEMGKASLLPYDEYYDKDPNTIEAYQETYNYYKKAADGGCPEAQYALGIMLLNKNLSQIKKDPAHEEKSKIWEMIKSAADKGIIEAQYKMIADDQWCKENAAKGIPIAQFGMGIRNDDDLYSSEYQKLYNLGETVASTPDYNVAAEWYTKAAENGLDVAQWRLGEMYARGLGVNKNTDKAIELRTKAADQGDVIFQLIMAMSYNYGEIANLEIFESWGTSENFLPSWDIKIPQDATKANYWLRKVSNHNLTGREKYVINSNSMYSDAMYILGELLEKKGEYSKAVYWLQRAGEKKGDEFYKKYALGELGRIFIEGLAGEKDYATAKKYLESGTEAGGYMAACYLGVLYRDGLGVQKDQEMARSYFMKAIKMEEWEPQPYYELAELYYTQSKYNDAATFYLKAIRNRRDKDGENPIYDEYGTLAYYKLGLMYLSGIGVEIDKNKAIEYISKAAYRGNEDARAKLKELGFPENLGEILHYYELGKDKYNDGKYDQAVQMFRFSAEKGFAAAQFYLGICYDKGRGVSENKQEAVKWYRLAAEQDITEAQFNLGYSYLVGEGVPIDYSEGVKWTLLAAEKGYRSAQEIMGWCYENGNGVPQNYSEAVRWYKLAAKQNSSYAIKQLKRLNEM